MKAQENIKNEALKYLNADFKFYERSYEATDCFGLVLLVRNEVFGTSYDFKDYSKLPRNNHLLEKLGEMTTFRSFNIKDVEVGDVIAFKFSKDSMTPQHVGIYLGDGDFIHADKRKGKVHVEKIDGYLSKIHSIHEMRK